MPWITQGAPTPVALAVIHELEDADTRGLDPARYHGSELEARAIRLARSANAPAPADSLAAFNTDLSRSVATFASDLHIGRVNPRQVKFEFVVDGKQSDLTDVVTRIAASRNPSAMFDSLEPPYAHYRALKRALQVYRARTDDPKQQQHIRQIELTMERWRWLPSVLGNRFIVVNVPAFQLYGFDLTNGNTDPRLVMPVVVGKAARTPTPIFSGRMQYVVFRPYWNIPPGILRNETLPKLRRNPSYLTSNRLEIVDAGAPDAPAKTFPVTSATLTRLASGALRIRERPGPKNSLGAVKFIFPNEYNVYLHDTPAQSLFNKDRRDFSHGCIRVGDPLALAKFVLADQPKWTTDSIKVAMTTGPESRRVPLTTPLNVYILYGTVLAQPNGTVTFYDDVYHLDAALERALRH
jgi:murein L,D-transpeptidase YcbB/YkuD